MTSDHVDVARRVARDEHCLAFELQFWRLSAATCTVPNFVGLQTRINSAQGLWGPGAGSAGFTTTILQQAGHSSGNYKITFQSIVGGQNVACNSTITVNG